MMLGLLLARQGVAVTVLEKHADFLRDFRGDTVHPSTLQALDDLGLGRALADAPHRDVDELKATFADGSYRIADFSRLRVAHPYIRFMPQWDFLDVLAGAAEPLPNFRLLRRHEVVDIIEEDGVVRGVLAEGLEGPVELRAGLTVAADGRTSIVRKRAGLKVTEFGAPMDVLWFRIGRTPDGPTGLNMHLGAGRILLAIDRGDYWQIAYVIPKGHDHHLRARPVDDLRASVTTLVPGLAASIEDLGSWDDVKTLSVQVDRLRRWHRPGLLCIGDAAHAMSPIGGVGINLAIQDAVCAARILAGPLPRGAVSCRTLRAIQGRRWLPTAGTQMLQRTAQRFLVQRTLSSHTPVSAPPPVRLLARFPRLQVIPARVVGVGLLPERITSPRRTGDRWGDRAHTLRLKP